MVNRQSSLAELGGVILVRGLGRAGWGGVLGGAWSDRLGSEVWEIFFFFF